MERIATQRLMEASSTLPEAARALLNLWIHRGLSDEALAAMAGSDPASITERKLDIVEHLSDRLVLPPFEVLAALTAIAASVSTPSANGAPAKPVVTSEIAALPDVAPSATDALGAPAHTTSEADVPVRSESQPDTNTAADHAKTDTREPAEVGNGSAMTPPGTLVPPPPAVPSAPGPSLKAAKQARPSEWSTNGVSTDAQRQLPTEPIAASGHNERRIGRPQLAASILLLVIVALVILINLDNGAPRSKTVDTRTTPAVTRTTSAQTRTTPGNTRPQRVRPGKPESSKALAALGGAPVNRGGEVAVVKLGSARALRLSTAGLRPVARGHYEVWLYNTIIDSEPIGMLGSKAHHATLRLPANARHYRLIDVSYQPPGFTSNSGQSVLRASNPLAPSH